MSKKKHRKAREVDYRATDWHHILYQKRHWSNGWAKRLRECTYCGCYIPKVTLHRTIHEYIGDVPVARGESCKKAFIRISEGLESGAISLNDSIIRRIEFLIESFAEDEPQTTRALEKQLEIVNSFYQHKGG